MAPRNRDSGALQSGAQLMLLLVGAKVAAGLVALLCAAFITVALLAGAPDLQAGEVSCGLAPGSERRVPALYHDLYQRAAEAYGLDPAVLAAIGEIESGHGRNMGPSSAGALGPMQFMPSTWAAYGVDGDGDGDRDIMDPQDAIPGAANYLRASGAPRNWRRALFAYNHADWYVAKVLARAGAYRGRCRVTGAEPSDTGGLAWPVRGPVVSPFGPRWGRLHAGIDIAAASGTPLRAAGAGRVAQAGPVSGYGIYVCLRHGPRLTTCYAHLGAEMVSPGEAVARGQVIGLIGCTGHCFGPHVHFEVRLGPPFSEPVDPIPYLKGAVT